MDRSADNHYPTSSLEVIKSRPVADIAADDCALLLWATVPMLPQALEVMAAWGFAYKSHAVWMKDQIGTGYWFRNQHELLLLGTRGNIPAPAMGDQFRSALAYPLGEHSAKPPFAHEIAEAYWPSLGKIELNARIRRPGWDAWGLEAPDAVHAVSEGIAMSFEEATPILQARYATASGDELARLIGRPVGTVRTWAHRLNLTSAARLKGNASHLGDKLKRPKETVS
jgi:N6-adenosine-specific RNA methylase IME4